jgi:CheY-like chemotaxis protein
MDGQALNRGAVAVGAQVILVVEDEILIRLLITDTLREAGYQVVEASTGDEAIRIVDSAQRIDLLVTDVRMPGSVDGVQLSEYWKLRYPARPVIVASGHLDPGAARAADEFLTKPYTDERLLALVEKHIGGPWDSKTQDRTAS